MCSLDDRCEQLLEGRTSTSSAPCCRQGRKRTRQMVGLRCLVFTGMVTTAHRVVAFTPHPVAPPSPYLAVHTTALGAVADQGVQPLQPLRKSNKEKRNKAYKAMTRRRVESALTGVDSHILELFSPDGSNVLLSTHSKSSGARRPKGRPELVPGAMNQDTMSKYQERQDALKWVQENTASLSDAEIAAVAPYVDTTKKVNGIKSQPTVKRGVKGEARTRSAEDMLKAAASPVTSTRQKKRVKKNLPKTRSAVDALQAREDFAKRTKNVNGMDLYKYYKTDLLTSDQEYSLGMKIQFMVECELVHEGLAEKLMRLPTMVEWAEACGFADPDPSFLAAEADEQLRPVGSEKMFEEIDPRMFMGNGLAIEAGPGRGRGRQKAPPPVKLGDFYDDSDLRAKSRKSDSPSPSKKKKNIVPINRGTATNFVEKLMAAREAKQTMVQSNMRLVVSIARKYSNVGVGLQDLIQEGSLGLSRAAEKFEPKKGFKFSTYASWWIQQSVFRSIAYHSRTIRLPVHVHNLLNRVRKVKTTLQSELGRAPTNEEIAADLGMPLEKYIKMLRLTKRSISLETPKYMSNPKDLGHASDDLLGDSIASTTLQDESTPEMKVDHGLFHKDLHNMLTILEEDERRVIIARYGLTDGLTRTVTAVAAEMRMPKAWVRSQECRALRKLRRPWYEKKLKEHQDALAS